MPTSETTRGTSTFQTTTSPSRCLQRAWRGKVTAHMLVLSSGGSATSWPRRLPWSLIAVGSLTPPSPGFGGSVTGKASTWRPTTLFTKVNSLTPGFSCVHQAVMLSDELTPSPTQTQDVTEARCLLSHQCVCAFLHLKVIKLDEDVFLRAYVSLLYL